MSERAAKRIRQACEPCRRKKSRCPGEKPVCTHCERLGQDCYYSNGPDTNDLSRKSTTPAPASRAFEFSSGEPRLEDRVRLIEAQLSEVLAGRAVGRSDGSNFANSPVSIPRLSLDGHEGRVLHNSLPSWNTLRSVGRAYIAYCDCQPLPLFHRQSFLDTLQDRDPEILFSILALAMRFVDDPKVLNSAHIIENYVEAARTIVSKKIFDGTVELSTIQSLCLLSLVDFTSGNTRRASIHSSLAMNLAHNADLTTETKMNSSRSLKDREECRRVFWSLLVLKRLHGADFSILDFTDEENFPHYPTTPDRPAVVHDGLQAKHPATEELGVIAYAIQLSQVWYKITKYARRRGKPSIMPPWSPQSEYSIIMAEQMDFETRMPYHHRFRPAHFSQHSSAELNDNRDYWGPWLFLQMLYHTNLCLLNHPLLLSLRLRNFKSMIPEIFLQHTSDLIASHASWIIHIIEMLDSKAFKVTDPFLGYCVAIVATIYLQESFVDDVQTRKEKEDNFNICLTFVRSMGEEWPHVARIASKLQKLAETVSATYVVTADSSSDSNQSQTPNRRLLIDLGQFWEILEYSSASEVPGSARLLFGPSLYSTSASGAGGSLVAKGQLAQTSPLPEPTRVERQDFAGSSAQASPIMQGTPTRAAETLLRPTGGAVNDRSENLAFGAGSADIGFVYSDDELAVLAESFFNQNQSQNQRTSYFEAGPSNDWWNTGNL